MTVLSSLGVLFLAAALSPSDKPDLTARFKAETDSFVFCTLDESMEQLESSKTPEAIAESAAEKCSVELDALEEAIAATYRDVNAGVWPKGMAEEEAAKARVFYRTKTAQSAVEIINERRDQKAHL
jgi:hypothetical protein